MDDAARRSARRRAGWLAALAGLLVAGAIVCAAGVAARHLRKPPYAVPPGKVAVVLPKVGPVTAGPGDTVAIYALPGPGAVGVVEILALPAAVLAATAGEVIVAVSPAEALAIEAALAAGRSILHLRMTGRPFRLQPATPRPGSLDGLLISG